MYQSILNRKSVQTILISTALSGILASLPTASYSLCNTQATSCSGIESEQNCCSTTIIQGSKKTLSCEYVNGACVTAGTPQNCTTNSTTCSGITQQTNCCGQTEILQDGQDKGELSCTWNNNACVSTGYQGQ